MAMINLPDVRPNSRFTEKEPEKTERVPRPTVVKGKTGIAKKPASRRLLDIFEPISIRELLDYWLLENVIPSVRDFIWESATGILEKKLYGNDIPKKSHSKGTGGTTYVSYNKFYDDRKSPKKHQVADSAPDENGTICYDSRHDAEEVLREMLYSLEKFGQVSLADYYEYSGHDAAFTDYQYGWTNLRGVKPHKLRDGTYILPLPRVRELDN